MKFVLIILVILVVVSYFIWKRINYLYNRSQSSDHTDYDKLRKIVEKDQKISSLIINIEEEYKIIFSINEKDIEILCEEIYSYLEKYIEDKKQIQIIIDDIKRPREDDKKLLKEKRDKDSIYSWMTRMIVSKHGIARHGQDLFARESLECGNKKTLVRNRAFIHYIEDNIQSYYPELYINAIDIYGFGEYKSIEDSTEKDKYAWRINA